MIKLDDKGAGVVDNNYYFLTDAVEDVNFEHAPVPAELEEVLEPQVHIRVLFTTGWGRARKQERNKIEAKKMEGPVLVEYEDGY